MPRAENVQASPRRIARPPYPEPSIAARLVRSPSNGGPSLQSQMHLDGAIFSDTLAFIRKSGYKHLDRTKRYQNQHPDAQSNHYNECKTLPIMQNYDNAWPINAYTKLYHKEIVKRRSRDSPRTTGPYLPSHALKASGPSKSTQPIAQERREQGRPAKSSGARAPIIMNSASANSERSNRVLRSARIASGNRRSSSREAFDRGAPRNAESSRRRNNSDIQRPVETSATRTRTNTEGGSTSVVRFLANINPPQDQFVQHFLHAGVSDESYLFSLAWSDTAQTEIITPLVRNKTMTVLQSVLIKDALKKLRQSA